MSLGDYKEPAF